MSLNMLYLHVTFRWFSLTFTEKITLSNVEYPIAVYANFPVNYLGVGSLGTLISWYTTRDQMMSCLQVKFSSGKSNKHSIILYFLWKEVNISENRYCNRYLQISIAFEGAPYPHRPRIPISKLNPLLKKRTQLKTLEITVTVLKKLKFP